MNYLNSSYFFGFENDLAQNLIAEFKDDSHSNKEKAIALHTKIRDEWKYDPYNLSSINKLLID